MWANRTQLAGRTGGGSGHERVKFARQPLADLLHLGHLPLQGAQHRPHMGPDRLRFHPHSLGHPVDELVGASLVRCGCVGIWSPRW